MKTLFVILAIAIFLMVSCSPPDEECKIEKLFTDNNTEISIE